VLSLRWSALETEFGNALDLVQEILRTTRFAPTDRLAELLRQRRSRLLSGVLGDGHLVAAQQAAARISPVYDLRNRWHGPAQLRLADALVSNLPASLPLVAQALERLRLHLLAAGSSALSHTGSPQFDGALRDHLGSFAGLPPLPPGKTESAPENPPGTALTLPAHGAHVAWCLPAPTFTAPAAPCLELGAHLLSLGEAWEEVRAKGGAYGVSCDYDSLYGSLAFLSYRDPSPERTLAVFDRIVHGAARLTWSPQQIAEALPAVVRTDQRPLRPPQLTESAFHNHLQGISYADRDNYRQRLLEATPETVVAALREAFADPVERSGICVLGDADLLADLTSPVPLVGSPLLGERAFDDQNAE